MDPDGRRRPPSQSGTYGLVARPPEGTYGRLWVGVGLREPFGWKEFAAFPTVVRDVHAFHEVPPRVPGTLFKVLSLAAVSTLIGFLASRPGS